MSLGRSNERLVKIAFLVPKTDGRPEIVETMWAIRQDDDTYVLDNSPFDAYNVSYKDRITAKFENGMLIFQNVVERGGHSTYRVKLNKGAEHSDFLKYWPQLALLGCTYEGAADARRLYSIDVPEVSAVEQVYTYLEQLEKKGAWEFEEAHYLDSEKDA